MAAISDHPIYSVLSLPLYIFYLQYEIVLFLDLFPLLSSPSLSLSEEKVRSGEDPCLPYLADIPETTVVLGR